MSEKIWRQEHLLLTKYIVAEIAFLRPTSRLIWIEANLPWISILFRSCAVSPNDFIIWTSTGRVLTLWGGDYQLICIVLILHLHSLTSVEKIMWTSLKCSWNKFMNWSSSIIKPRLDNLSQTLNKAFAAETLTLYWPCFVYPFAFQIPGRVGV